MSTVAIVGGGLIGSAAGAWLIADGFDVTVFERDPDGRPASTGNAGVISLPDISPLARPAMLWSAAGWMLDPLGPLTVRARDLPALAPWLAAFVAAARPSRVERATAALGFLMKTALADHQELARRAELTGTMRRTGALYVYDSDAGFRAGLAEWRERGRFGVAYRELSLDEAREMAPALTGPFSRAIFAPDAWTVSSPLEILTGLRRAVAAGGRLEARAVASVRTEGDGAVVTDAAGGETRFDRVLIAGGVWSRDLVRGLGLRVLLESERGYNTTYPDSPIALPLPVFFAEHAFCATPLADGLRVGGAVELAATEAPANFARAAAMRRKMRRYVPDLPETGGREWMGCRPSTPDSLPVIGAHPGAPQIVFAFGHGHLGLTLSAVTARHVSDIFAGRRDRNLEAVGIERFQ